MTKPRWTCLHCMMDGCDYDLESALPLFSPWTVTFGPNGAPCETTGAFIYDPADGLQCGTRRWAREYGPPEPGHVHEPGCYAPYWAFHPSRYSWGGFRRALRKASSR